MIHYNSLPLGKWEHLDPVTDVPSVSKLPMNLGFTVDSCRLDHLHIDMSEEKMFINLDVNCIGSANMIFDRFNEMALSLEDMDTFHLEPKNPSKSIIYKGSGDVLNGEITCTKVSFCKNFMSVGTSNGYVYVLATRCLSNIIAIDDSHLLHNEKAIINMKSNSIVSLAWTSDSMHIYSVSSSGLVIQHNCHEFMYGVWNNPYDLSSKNGNRKTMRSGVVWNGIGNSSTKDDKSPSMLNTTRVVSLSCSHTTKEVGPISSQIKTTSGVTPVSDTLAIEEDLVLLDTTTEMILLIVPRKNVKNSDFLELKDTVGKISSADVMGSLSQWTSSAYKATASATAAVLTNERPSLHLQSMLSQSSAAVTSGLSAINTGAKLAKSMVVSNNNIIVRYNIIPRNNRVASGCCFNNMQSNCGTVHDRNVLQASYIVGINIEPRCIVNSAWRDDKGSCEIDGIQRNNSDTISVSLFNTLGQLKNSFELSHKTCKRDIGDTSYSKWDHSLSYVVHSVLHPLFRHVVYATTESVYIDGLRCGKQLYLLNLIDMSYYRLNDELQLNTPEVNRNRMLLGINIHKLKLYLSVAYSLSEDNTSYGVYIDIVALKLPIGALKLSNSNPEKVDGNRCGIYHWRDYIHAIGTIQRKWKLKKQLLLKHCHDASNINTPTLHIEDQQQLKLLRHVESHNPNIVIKEIDENPLLVLDETIHSIDKRREKVLEKTGMTDTERQDFEFALFLEQIDATIKFSKEFISERHTIEKVHADKPDLDDKTDSDAKITNNMIPANASSDITARDEDPSHCVTAINEQWNCLDEVAASEKCSISEEQDRSEMDDEDDVWGSNDSIGNTSSNSSMYSAWDADSLSAAQSESDFEDIWQDKQVGLTATAELEGEESEEIGIETSTDDNLNWNASGGDWCEQWYMMDKSTGREGRIGAKESDFDTCRHDIKTRITNLLSKEGRRESYRSHGLVKIQSELQSPSKQMLDAYMVEIVDASQLAHTAMKSPIKHELFEMKVNSIPYDAVMKLPLIDNSCSLFKDVSSNFYQVSLRIPLIFNNIERGGCSNSNTSVLKTTPNSNTVMMPCPLFLPHPIFFKYTTPHEVQGSKQDKMCINEELDMHSGNERELAASFEINNTLQHSKSNGSLVYNTECCVATEDCTECCIESGDILIHGCSQLFAMDAQGEMIAPASPLDTCIENAYQYAGAMKLIQECAGNSIHPNYKRAMPSERATHLQAVTLTLIYNDAWDMTLRSEMDVFDTVSSADATFVGLHENEPASVHVPSMSSDVGYHNPFAAVVEPPKDSYIHEYVSELIEEAGEKGDAFPNKHSLHSNIKEKRPTIPMDYEPAISLKDTTRLKQIHLYQQKQKLLHDQKLEMALQLQRKRERYLLYKRNCQVDWSGVFSYQMPPDFGILLKKWIPISQLHGQAQDLNSYVPETGATSTYGSIHGSNEECDMMDAGDIEQFHQSCMEARPLPTDEVCHIIAERLWNQFYNNMESIRHVTNGRIYANEKNTQDQFWEHTQEESKEYGAWRDADTDSEDGIFVAEDTNCLYSGRNRYAFPSFKRWKDSFDKFIVNQEDSNLNDMSVGLVKNSANTWADVEMNECDVVSNSGISVNTNIEVGNDVERKSVTTTSSTIDDIRSDSEFSNEYLEELDTVWYESKVVHSMSHDMNTSLSSPLASSNHQIHQDTHVTSINVPFNSYRDRFVVVDPLKYKIFNGFQIPL